MHQQDTPTDWLEIKLETNNDFDADTLEEALFAAGALSVTLTSKADEVILIEPAPGELPLWEKGIVVTGLFDKGTAVDDVLPILSACLGTEKLPLLATETLADRQWELEWTHYFKPLQFGRDLWICPSNQTLPEEKITASTKIITLDPGLAFGTGTHPTTAMALNAIASADLAGKSVVDYGCGSGILGIAAVKMGANSAIMTDIDAKALQTSADNAKINHVSDSVYFYLPEDMPDTKTDVLIANILLEPLLMLKDTFVNLCHPNSHILLTGLLKEQVQQIIQYYERDFDHFSVTESGDWAMITANKR